MTPISMPPPRRGVGTSLLISSVLHALAVLSLWLFGGQGGRAPVTEVLLVDNRVAEPERNISLVLVDAPTRPTPKVTVVTSAAPIEPPPSLPRAATAGASPTTAAPKSVPLSHGETAETASNVISQAKHESAGASAGASSSRDATSFFDVPARGKSFVYVIDRSASMGAEGRLIVAKSELRLSLAKLPADVRFQVIPYNRFAEPLRLAGRTDLVPATAENKRLALAVLDAIEAEGSTDHLPALRRALALHPDAIFFLTDADDLRLDQVRTVSQLNRDHVVIHAIELDTRNRDRTDMPLHLLAGHNGGIYQAVQLPQSH